jgi:hypothetical protein
MTTWPAATRCVVTLRCQRMQGYQSPCSSTHPCMPMYQAAAPGCHTTCHWQQLRHIPEVCTSTSTCPTCLAGLYACGRASGSCALMTPTHAPAAPPTWTPTTRRVTACYTAPVAPSPQPRPGPAAVLSSVHINGDSARAPWQLAVTHLCAICQQTTSCPHHQHRVSCISLPPPGLLPTPVAARPLLPCPSTLLLPSTCIHSTL